MKIKIEKLYNSFVQATAYAGLFRKKELGVIVMSAEANCFWLTHFRVRESYRNKGIGKLLLQAMIEEAARAGGKEHAVWPSSETYDEEKPVDEELLYKIYEKLGFRFDAEDSDGSEFNIKRMIIKFDVAN